MSTPEKNLSRNKKAPLLHKTRIPPYKQKQLSEEELLAQVLDQDRNAAMSKGKIPNDKDLLSSMMKRLSVAEKRYEESEFLIKEKEKRIRVLEDKCEIYRKAQGYGSDCVAELEKKCHKLQKQIHSMEEFLEDYGMIWIGNKDSSDEEEEEIDENKINVQQEDTSPEIVMENGTSVMWSPDVSVAKNPPFMMSFDLVLANIQELNQIAGEGEHFIKHTKDGAKLQIKDSVPLILYGNGIFMFEGPFRPYDDMTTQRCMKDIMDGYFPSELQALYPDGVPFKVEDKREVRYQDKRLQKLFPGQGHALSPEKTRTPSYTDIGRATTTEHIQAKQTECNETKAIENRQSVDRFLSGLPVSVVKNGKIIDIRDGLKDALTDDLKNDVVVVDTEVVDDMKARKKEFHKTLTSKIRLSSGRRSRPQSSTGITTLRIKSETGDQTFILKMRNNETIANVKNYLQTTRNSSTAYDLKTSFPNQTYTDETKTLQECGLIPNATLHIVVKK